MRQGIFTSWTAVFHPNRLNETAVNGETQFSRISLRYDEGTKPSFGIFTISLFFKFVFRYIIPQVDRQERRTSITQEMEQRFNGKLWLI